MADFGRAWDHFYESWQMCRKKKDLRGRWVNTVNLSNLAVVLLSNYKDERYVPYAELALQEELNAIEQAETGDPMQLVIIYSNLGTLRTLKLRKELQKDGQDKEVEQVLTTLKEVENCYDLFHQGLEICRKQGYTREEGVLLKNLAEVAELAGDDPAAYDYLKQCRERLVKEGNDEGLWRVMYSIGNLMKKEAVLISIPEKERKDPIQLYREAIDLLEVLPIEEENSEERLSGRDERWKIYLDAAWESIRSGDPEQGLVFLEKGRMKTVADIMARRPPALRRERHKIVWGNIRYVRTRLEEIRRKLEQINVPQEIEKLLQERKGYEQEYRSLMNRIVEEDGTLGYLAGARPFRLGEIQELIAEDEVVIAYAMDDHQTYAYSVEPDTLLCQVIPIKMESLYEKVEEMLGQIATDSISITTITELYQILLRPLEKVFEKKTRVVIVPDGILWQLPFEALSDGARLFSDNRMVIYLPSLAAYRLVWEKRRINQDDGLFAGDPLDASYIASMQQTAQVVSRLGQEATEERIRDDMKTADLIQFERWAVYQEDPLTSHMVFYAGGVDDGYIRADEIFSWDMRASLALLPSSHTSHAYGWKGTTVFFYGLLYAGVPTVVSGRWQAPREVKKTFYDELYGSLGQEAASTAFQKARDHLRERYPEVRDWAAFQYIGYAGMNNQAKMQFARENLVHTVLEGRAFEGRGEFQDGIEAFEKALDMAIAMGDTQSVQRIYQEIIRTSVSGALYTTAADYQNRVREIAERGGDRQGVWNSLRNLVAFYMRDRQYDEAVKVKQEEIQFIESGDMLSLAGSYEELSFIHSAGRDYRDAADWVSKAIEIYEKEGDDFGLARSLIRRGRYELEGDNYWNAQSDLSRGVQILESFTGQQALDTRLGDLASAYQFLGLTYERLARFQEAAEYQQKGIDLFTRLGRPQKVAEGNQYLANLYWQMGDYRQASNHQKAATEAFEAAGDKSLIAVAYSTQGLINMSLGDLPGARKNVFRALSLAEESNSLENQATILKNMGLIALQDADFRQAFDYFHRASTIDSSLMFRRGLASDYRNLGVLQLYLENPGKGLPFLREGLRLSREIGDRRNEVQSYYGLGQIYRAMQDYRPSLAALDSGLTQTDDLAIPEVQWRLYRERAKTYQDMKQDEEALKDLRHAVDIVEGLRAELKVESFKQGFLDNKMDLYADLIQQLLRMNRIQEAYDFVERAKSRNFIDLLGNQDLILTKAHGELLEREKKVRIEVQEAMERLAWYAEAAVTPKMLEEKQQWQTELEKRRKAYEEVLISIQSDNPELASMVSVDPWDYQRIQGLLPDSTALLEYFITAGKLYSWLIMPGEIMAREDILGKEMLESTIRHFRENIQAHLSVEIESRQLFQWLILPWSKQLKNISRLIVIPHGILHYIPFSALMDEEGLYLLDRMAVTLAPSGTVLGYCMEKGGAPASGDETLLAMSNPQLGSPSFDLPFAEKEVKSLRRSFNNVTAFFGEDVTERKVREEVGAYDLIHFACHGTYTAESPLFSALLLTQEGEDDGRLEAHEIFGLDLNCNLVTLSACETGLSQITGGDEIIGLARSFIFAGTPSIITSLWKVDDLATAVMVKRFYRYLSMGMSRDRALQRAQLLVKDELNGHPAFWAAFNLTGDFR